MLPNIETYILSGLLVMAIPLVSHYSGICFKQYEETPKYKYHLLFILPLIVGFSIALSILRSNYIFIVLKVVQDINDKITFIGLSIILFVVGIIVSFLHHDKNQELVEEYNTFNDEQNIYDKSIKNIEQKLSNAREKHLVEIKNIDSTYEIEKSRIESTIPDCNKKRLDMITYHDRVLSSFRALEKRVNANYLECLNRYREKSLRNRKNNNLQPISWRKEVEALETVFNKLQELDINKPI